MVNAYKSEHGQRLAYLEIRRWRGKQMGQSIDKVIVYYEGIYGIIDVKKNRIHILNPKLLEELASGLKI
jgi:hypothetical protein